MNITIKAQQVQITDALKKYASKKLEKLDKFYDQIQSITISLDVLSAANDNDSQQASATVFASGTLIRGKETSADMYASIDLLYEKLEKQLVKYKEKQKDHKKHASRISHHEKKTSSAPSSQDYEDSLELHYVPKPIDPEDAVALLEERHINFIVFRDIEHERVCVVYPLDSGEYGLIET